ncbi:MAG: hypothetical protein QME60_04385 [Verrucomicrobiota bacterium]|nr:hypothetical protein [Verrucomicrobiota bacterium]
MAPDFEQNAVSRVVWRWQAPPAKAGAETARARRIRAGVQFVVLLALALVLWLLHRATGKPRGIVAPVVAGLAVFVLLIGFLAPPLFDATDRMVRALGRLIGVALTWALLTPFFFLVFVPARILLALRGKDPMRRAFRSSEPTFWVSRTASRAPDRYRKQY